MPSRLSAVPAGLLLGLGSLLTTTTLLFSVGAAPAAAAPIASTPVAALSSDSVSSTSASPDIEALAGPVPATTCEPFDRSGTTALGVSLSKAYPKTGYRISHTCDTPSLEEQRQGRVVSWQVAVSVKTQVVQARTMLDRLLATDPTGNPYAGARRLGVTRVVWGDREWRADAPAAGFRAYSSCATQRAARDDSRCGRSTMQIALSWAGALGQTSRWTGKAAQVDFGPCRPADLAWAYRYYGVQRQPCPTYPALAPGKGATTADRDLVAWSGVRLTQGATGEPVRVLQRALRVDVDGRLGSSTVVALSAWQRGHGLPDTAKADAATWRTLLRARLSVPMTTTPPTQPAQTAAPVQVVSPAPSAAPSSSASPPASGSTVPASTMPVSSQSQGSWRRLYSEDFVTPASIGSFVTAKKDDWYLQPAHPYARSLRAYPDGWGTTGNLSLNYPSRTTDVVVQDHDAPGVFRLRAHSAVVDGQQRSLAGSFFAVIDPSASGPAQVAQTYGRYSVRFQTVGGRPTTGPGARYGSAFLLWPADDTWADGEVDFPEMAWGGQVNGYVHTIGKPAVNAAVIGSPTTTEGGWHVATIEWRPGALVFSLDGTVLQTVTHDVPTKPFRWGFQSGGHDGTPAPGVEGQLLIDWITVDAWTGPR